jgi:catalase
MNFNREGQLNHRIHKGTVNYWSNRFEATPQTKDTGETNAYKEFRSSVVGVKDRVNSVKFEEYFNQAQLFYNSLSEVEKLHVQSAFAFELDHCDDPIVYKRVTRHRPELRAENCADGRQRHPTVR